MLMNSFWSSVPAMCSFVFAMKTQVDIDKMINKIDRAVRDALFLTETHIAKDIIPGNIQNSKLSNNKFQTYLALVSFLQIYQQSRFSCLMPRNTHMSPRILNYPGFVRI